MTRNNDNLIPADFIFHGSNENEHFLDPDKLPNEVSSRLRNAVMEAEITKRFEVDLPKHKAIWKAEAQQIREEDNKISTAKINTLLMNIDRLEQEKISWVKETKLNLEKLNAEKDKEVIEKLQLIEKKYNLEISSLKNQINEQKEKNNKKNDEIEKIRNESEINLLKEKNKIKEEFAEKEEYLRTQNIILENDNKNLKEYRSGHSKINGNNLEEHILNEAAYHINMGLRGSIEKDTNPVNRGMVDFIYRGFDNQNNKVIEVGIEVKNESLDSSHTQKNIKHYPKFEKNCNDKNLEYKILVSTLEPGNKLFDDGIYRVPNYKNMYVCRPQHLMAFLGLLTDQASERFKDKETLKQARESNFQVEVIQENMNIFRLNFLKEINEWEGSYDSALKLIETIMQKLNKLKLELLNGRNSIKYLTDKVEDFNIKKLTSSGKLLQSSQAGNK